MLLIVLDGVEEDADDTSDLTLGGIVCGNPSKALRLRARHQPRSESNIETAETYSDSNKKRLFARVGVKPIYMKHFVRVSRTFYHHNVKIAICKIKDIT